MTGMTVELAAFIDADGNPLEFRWGEVPLGCIGGIAIVEGYFVAVPVTTASKTIDGNLGAYETYQLAAEALRSNHRRAWSREERRRALGGW